MLVKEAPGVTPIKVNMGCGSCLLGYWRPSDTTGVGLPLRRWYVGSGIFTIEAVVDGRWKEALPMCTENRWAIVTKATPGILFMKTTPSYLYIYFRFTWCRHQMETFPRNWLFARRIHQSPVNSPHKSQWRGALTFSLIYAWINGWVNNREAGDLRRHRAHYDVFVMINWHSRQTVCNLWWRFLYP